MTASIRLLTGAVRALAMSLKVVGETWKIIRQGAGAVFKATGLAGKDMTPDEQKQDHDHSWFGRLTTTAGSGLPTGLVRGMKMRTRNAAT